MSVPLSVTNKHTKKKRISFMKLAESGFETCDLFGIPIKLNFNGKDAIKSKPGSFVSIAISFLFIAYAIKRGQDLIFQTGPTVN